MPYNTQSICVMGLGYIGLPTASVLATKGFSVLFLHKISAKLRENPLCRLKIQTRQHFCQNVVSCYLVVAPFRGN